MAREKSTMELKEIVTRLKLGHSIKQIHREIGIHKTVIRKLKKIARAHNWLASSAEKLPAEEDIYAAYYGTDQSKSPHALDALSDELKKYAEDKLSYVVIHQLIRSRVSCSASTVRRYMQSRIETSIPKSVVLRPREMGVMEVDFGRLGAMYDDSEKRNRVAYIFSGRLRCSAKAFRTVVFDQKQETFWECHIRAFEYFGGVPERVVPDNLKAAVVKASFTDPVINRGYHELAEYYGFLIDPCQPYKPQHKGGVENDIKYVKRNFYAAFRERQRQKGRDIPLARECLQALREWERDIADRRILRSVGLSPDELFVQEQPFLRPLPSERFDPVTWKQCTVRRDGRIGFDRSTYTVPDTLTGKEVLIAANSRNIRIFHRHCLVAEHLRASRPYQDVVKPEHLSYRALAFIEHTREGLLHRAKAVGPEVENLVRLLLEDRAVSRQRAAWGILSLAQKYGPLRVNAACARAIAYDAPRYDTVKRILEQKLDALPEHSTLDSHGQGHLTFAREPGYFNTH